MSISPFVVLAALLVLAFLLGGGAAYLQGLQYRKTHPSIEARRKELEVQVKLDYITEDEYANKIIALDREEAEVRARRRVK